MIKEENASGLQLLTYLSADTLQQLTRCDIDFPGHKSSTYTPLGLLKRSTFETSIYCVRGPEDQYIFVPGRGFVGLLNLTGFKKANVLSRWWKSVFDYLESEVQEFAPKNEGFVEGKGIPLRSQSLAFAVDNVFFCLGDRQSLDFAGSAMARTSNKKANKKFERGMKLGWEDWLSKYRDAGLLTPRRNCYRQNAEELDLWKNNNVALFIDELGFDIGLKD